MRDHMKNAVTFDGIATITEWESFCQHHPEAKDWK
jgi:hypothetical protein